MNSKSLRRLATDHGSLHTAGLPPNYLFPPSSDDSADLTSLDVLLAGPVGTPYAGGVWRLHLDIPPTYPAAPPTAQFRTRLWHPNIDEATGAVCVETLKRDWSSTLKLRDVLVTISCLLIQPNPASALNEAAGKLATEDWDTYCRRAKLMTDIHAAIPRDILQQVKEAQMRGDSPPPQESSNAMPQQNSKGASSIKTTPTTLKIQCWDAEDEENSRRRGITQEPDSDPESDWIPGPGGADISTTRRQDDNIFGIKGLNNSLQQQSSAGRIVCSGGPSTRPHAEGDQCYSDPSVSVKPNRSQHLTTIYSGAETNGCARKSLTAFPRKARLTSQPSHQSHPLLREFSVSWQDVYAFNEGNICDAEIRKRLASTEFEQQRVWEMKRFRKAGCNLGRYNRGDFGPKTGIGRL